MVSVAAVTLNAGFDKARQISSAARSPDAAEPVCAVSAVSANLTLLATAAANKWPNKEIDVLRG